MLTILWIDDEHSKQEAFINFAKVKYDIELRPFDLRVKGMEVLEKNIQNYDAVILDAKMLDESSDERPGTKGLFKSIHRLNELKGKNIFIPFVIYTAQPDLLSEELFNNSTNGINKYKKGTDNDKMLIDIIEKVKDLPNTKIRNKYSRAFQLCTNEYLREEYASKLLELVTALESEEVGIKTEDKLITVRKIIEKIFQKFHSIGVLPLEVIEGEGSLTKSCLFLSGKHSGYDYINEILHPVIALQLKNILDLTQDGAHSREKLKLRVDEFIRNQGTPYLFKSIVIQLLDLMIWCKSYFDTHQDIDSNRKITKPKNSIEGVINKDENDNYYFSEYLLNKKIIVKNNLKVGSKIIIAGSVENSVISLKVKYPFYVPYFEIIK